ncbi:sugar phosphate nucleotidyltransferase [Dubosiella newyorkensis]|uniref:Mannose-1-phosphate guanylyltransferase n=1 Tax=Dubosiella newyorkensis TaxID=1862672 RepID=A0A1U7NKJ7_9FIRM|nr:sugar phosphate nucleotidyltransferase [Dubosiella newyorkensis]OLU44767.1 mannose-1-phosphate guanylyltransferase [Dubosiella newyorkensis]
MNIVLLSGGSGKRLWPLSNDVRSKQFIKFFKNEYEEYESMVQRVYRQILEVDPEANITIATSKSQVSSIRNQLGENVSISIEPDRRDTFPAIALASSFLADQQELDPEEVVIVCPVDPYVDIDYYEALKCLEEAVKTSNSNLVLMGMEPTYPSEKYGYILPKTTDTVSEVSMFLEKPDEEKAREYIDQGALWNGGIFAFKLGYLLNKAHSLIDFTNYEDLFARYSALKKISFDYEVVEKEPSISVVRYNGEWKDVGTWNTLTETMHENVIGNGILDRTCENVHIINELDAPVVAVGLDDIVISASPEGILVSDKEQSSDIKRIVDSIEQEIMFAEKSWGDYQVLDVGSNSLTIKITLNAGNKMSTHYHQNRDEMWTVISGHGKCIVDGHEREIGVGDIITMQANQIHSVEALSDLQMIEVQIGKDIRKEDKIKVEVQ